MEEQASPVSAAQRRVLVALKRQGEATAEELAESLGVTSSAVRQHLAGLRSAGFVTSVPERGHTGRPADRYHATASSEKLFGAGADLAVHLLELVDDEDPELVDRLFARHRARLVTRSGGGGEDRPVDEQVTAVTELLDAEGYLTDCEVTDDGRYLIHLHSCPMWEVADRYRQTCAAELGAVQDLIPDARVCRTTHKTAGAHTCTYEIDPKGQA